MPAAVHTIIKVGTHQGPDWSGEYVVCSCSGYDPAVHLSPRDEHRIRIADFVGHVTHAGPSAPGAPEYIEAMAREIFGSYVGNPMPAFDKPAFEFDRKKAVACAERALLAGRVAQETPEGLPR